MYPPSFDYYRADSVEEAIDLLAERADEEVELLSGGHSLLPTMKTGLARPDALIDIGGIEDLQGIEEDGGTTRIGALTKYATVVDSETAGRNCPAFAAATSQVGDRQVRNRGTVGGNLAHSDPASDLPGAALAADATIHVQGPDGTREVPADEFFLGMYATDLAEDEILTAVEIPSADPGDAGAYAKKRNPASGYALVGVAARLETDGDEIERARVAANGAMDHAVRLDPVEDALAGASVDDEDLAADAAERATDDLDTFMLMDDLQASNEFRAQLLTVYAERALETALERAGARATA